MLGTIFPKRSPFRKYRSYIIALQQLVNLADSGLDQERRIQAALNGQPSGTLQKLSSVSTRRKYGAYFTSTSLSDRLISLCKSMNDTSSFYDASCGMGDLLLAAAKKFPLEQNLPLTLSQWGSRLAGTDLQPEFIEGTKLRLALLARQRLQSFERLSGTLNRFFPNIKEGNGLRENDAFYHATTILMNTPFGYVPSEPGCAWAKGRVPLAAIFMIKTLEKIRPGTEVLAILPEVLRCGTFSERWRQFVGQLAEVHEIEPYGMFGGCADVDVFLLRLVRRGKRELPGTREWPLAPSAEGKLVGDLFNVHVGRVVPHRDQSVGPEYAYIHPRCVPTWTTLAEFNERRKHNGQPFQPPFVVIRRTSRLGDHFRAAASVIVGKDPVAVENHLIVCEPKDKTIKTCKMLMRHLKTDTTNHFLNDRIRCRHLTVQAVSEIPFI